MAQLKTDRLLLRPFAEADTPALHSIYSNPEAMQYWSKPPFDDIAQTDAFVRAVLAADPATTLEFVVERQGRVIGRAGFWQGAEIGYLFHPDHWGQGYGTEAIGAMIAHAFAEQGIERATADVDPRNAASLALLKKLGFRETGRAANTIEIAGVWCDSVYLALEAADWRR